LNLVDRPSAATGPSMSRSLPVLSLDKPGRVTLGGAPEGFDARVLASLAGSRRILHVCVDDVRMARLVEDLEFFAPQLQPIAIPAWDCLPYDRVSPHRDIVARRIDGLSRLATAPGPARVAITTVAAFLQRLPPRAGFATAMLELAQGRSQAPESVISFLTTNGYARSGTVAEAGEFALRGGIIDVFPPGAATPLRIDFFGDEIEAIREFDPLTQRSAGRLERFVLRPVSELRLDAEAIARFRSGYRERFGAVVDDPLYEAVSTGRLYPGLEHWLPLFLPGMETLLDYMADAVISFDYQAEEAIQARFDTIADFYQARAQMLRGGKGDGAAVYRPLPPDALYLGRSELAELLPLRNLLSLSPFAAAEGEPDAGGRRGRDFAEARARPEINLYDAVRQRIAEEQAAGRRVLIAAVSEGSRDRLEHVLADHGLARREQPADWLAAATMAREATGFVVLALDQGFTASDLAVIAEPDILGDRMARPTKKRARADRFLTELASFAEGDYVVHVDHGVGRYEGLETLDVGGAPHDCLKMVYDGNDKLYVPVENIEVLSRYSSEDTPVQLDRLGGVQWQARKARVKQRLRDIAQQLMKTAAARAVRAADPIQAPAGLYDEFAARFPYAETDDQTKAIEEVLADLGSGRPMDRLVCGDVGFGKTEVALRAAFVVAMSGKQVAVIAPTTLLCRQHLKTFTARFEGLPLRIRQLSRLVGAKEAAETKVDLSAGRVDIVIGTHALLGKAVSFARLGLIIVDEEQHFGVAQKEKLKDIGADIHVLTLTATPIPRTLQLALSGVREMSLIATPPVDRLAIRTFVLPYDPVIVREAIMREHYRGGQVFYVCPRIEDIGRLGERIASLVPEVKMVVAHGQMAPTRLEKAMTAFYDRQYDLLLSTNIIESGLDIPTANTMIVHRSEMFGLAQLYQLRGRIGRSKLRGYAYLTLPPERKLSPTALKRLEVMQTLDQLGAGFTLASHDLDIRGAGNLLGSEQSGHIREVGIELYQHMLEEAVAEARGAGEPAAGEAWTPQINLGMPVLIPESYVADLPVRLALYRRIAMLVDQAEIDAFAAEMIDRFGALPGEVENLLKVVAIKRLCRAANVDKVEAGPKGAVVSLHENRFSRPDRLIDFIARQGDRASVRPDHRMVFRQSWDEPQARVKGVESLMEKLAALAA
jgi:transcription-repair coupling factor (superfamily II helicase)